MRRRYALSLLLPLPLAVCAASPAAETGLSHVERSSEAQGVAISADGLYQVRAGVRMTDAVQSADGSYRFKSTAATCDPSLAVLFADGFE